MIVYVVVCEQEARAFAREQDTNMLYKEWVQNINLLWVSKYKCEVENYE